jgi:hypothetical protein
MMDPRKRDNFILLTEKALSEDDPDRFIECLMKRNTYVSSLLKDDPRIFGEKKKDCLEKETQVLKRLKQEKRHIIEEIDNLLKNKKVPGGYFSKFPLPAMPVFFKVTG